MEPNTKTILILGGSYAGISTAHYILKHVIPTLPNKDDYRVAFVSSSSHFFCRPTSPRALVSETAFPKEKSLFVPLTEAFDQYTSPSITLYHATVIKLDHLARIVTIIPANEGTADINLKYHALIIATGVTAESPLMGLRGDHRNTIEAWTLFRKKLSSAKSIVITGGGPTGVETAGELGQYLNGTAGGKPNVSITLVTRSRRLLPYFPLSVSQKAEAQLSKLGVSVIKDKSVEKVISINFDAVDTAGKSLERLTDTVVVHLSDDETLQADLYIPATGVSPNTGFLHRQLLDNEGYVNVNSSSLRVESAGPRVYALGHVCSSTPRAIHAIMKQAPVVGENLKQGLLSAEDKVKDGEAAYRVYEPESTITQLVVIGKKGVGMALGWRVPSFFVWLIKGRDYWLGMTPPMWNGRQFTKSLQLAIR
ncbi:disulfide oxidoreductase, putative [Talaromyces stipitatus ATCC 10500]|uniref:Disulfide oxidoreductase, putative n=1 Tax=Talaromyces stipitatus (strain ATCC 10500 / CBS 375.48 / QM 6759 / NRRL 1006) TaxID=441959 RepID=B8M042_TALSN|nr:disulfide oxidoreductase, putative [Talaromyces stipitatus ATCC 10500]EED21139.1 disulfide oxidoreductase, putative [Talaromyces stipitatus ATCC 10500]